MEIDYLPVSESLRKPSRMFVIAGLLLSSLILVGCPGGNKSGEAPTNSVATTPGKISDFDGDRAFEHVRKQVEFGPRPPGSPELEKTRAYILDQLKSYGLKITTDEFHARTPVRDRKMVNLTAELPGESSDVIIVSSHYDTKYITQFKFVGADDAGSSTGALLELARVMAARKE